MIVQTSTLVMLVILALLFSSSGEEGITRQAFSLGMVLAVSLFVSVFLHEVAHAIAARAFKREVSEIVITLWGGHTSFDSRNLTPLINGVVSIAGPAANLVIAAVVGVVMNTAGFTGALWSVSSWIVYANLLLAAFNALPGIPMDGGRALEAVVWGVTNDRHKGTRVAAWAGRVIAVGVLVVSVALPFLRGNSPSLFTVIWGFVIFSILWPAASAALKTSTAQVRMEMMGTRRLMVPAVAVSHGVTVQEARELAERAGAVEVVVLGADGEPAGRFPVALTEDVPQSERARTYLPSVTMPLPRGAEIPADLTGQQFVNHLQQWWGKTDVWFVREHGSITGVVHLAQALKELQ